MSWERPGLLADLHTGTRGNPGWRCWQELGGSGDLVKPRLICGFLRLEPDSDSHLVPEVGPGAEPVSVRQENGGWEDRKEWKGLWAWGGGGRSQCRGWGEWVWALGYLGSHVDFYELWT